VALLNLNYFFAFSTKACFPTLSCWKAFITISASLNGTETKENFSNT